MVQQVLALLGLHRLPRVDLITTHQSIRESTQLGRVGGSFSGIRRAKFLPDGGCATSQYIYKQRAARGTRRVLCPNLLQHQWRVIDVISASWSQRVNRPATGRVP